jgi:hypothetical protein
MSSSWTFWKCGPRSSAAAIEAGAIGLPSRSNQFLSAPQLWRSKGSQPGAALLVHDRHLGAVVAQPHQRTRALLALEEDDEAAHGCGSGGRIRWVVVARRGRLPGQLAARFRGRPA